MFPYLLTLSAQAQSTPSSGGATPSMNPDISFIADVAVAAFSGDEPLQSGAHDPTKNGFNLQQLEMALGSPVDPFFRLDGNIVFSQFGVEIEEIYATTMALPGRWQVRVGQFLTRFGRINNTHPHSWDFVDQPFAIGRVMGGEGNRELGLEASWFLPLPWYAEIVGSTNMIGGEATHRSWSAFNGFTVQGPQDLQTTAALKQFHPLSDDLSVFWGLSFAGGPNGSGRANRTEVYGADLYIKQRPITQGGWRHTSLQAEGLMRRRQVPDDLVVDFSGYAYVHRRFNRRWGVAVRHGWGSPEVGEEGSTTDVAIDPQWTSLRQRVGANATWWPSEFSRIRVQGATDWADWLPQQGWSAFVAFEFNVGAHGAHAF